MSHSTREADLAHTVIEPANYRRETRLVGTVVALIVVAITVTAWARSTSDAPVPLFDWQISAFYDLNSTDQAIYNALLVAADELWYAHGDLLTFGDEDQKAKPWPSVDELDEWYLLPPFARDVAWAQQGEIEWDLVAWYGGARLDGSTVYFGSKGRLPDQSAYLLMLSHVHKGASWADGAQVWIHGDPNVSAPEIVVRDSLIKDGWKEVVPYSGAMEVERLKG